jgi:myo-inositol-1(or 4)-monophosphatase
LSAVDFEHFVARLADVSGEAILPFFRTSLSAQDKNHGGVFDPVTEADRAAEIAIRRMIKAQFPAHGVLGEEFGAEATLAEHVWVIDPIDGTKSFISGLPVWGTLIGLMKNQRPVYGMMNQPFTRERFFGDGQNAWWIGPAHRGAGLERRKLRTRPCAGLANATLMTTSPLLFGEAAKQAYLRLESQVRLPRYGGDCYAYCALAAGHVDLVVEDGLKVYDIAALIPIIEGAGGVITSWDGGDAAQGGSILAAGDPRTHEAAMKALAGAA